MRVRPAAPDAIDAADFRAFFEAAYPGLVRTLFLCTSDSTRAEDLAQEAMARTFERWDRVRSLDSPEGYVYKTALNLNRKLVRRLAVRRRHQPEISEPPDDAGRTLDRVVLQTALDSLPRGQREAVILTEWLGLDSAEAGRLIGVPASTVRSRVRRGHAALRERIGDYHE
jgi:RNA polymerase sigma factor (sigma-70 family)